MGRKGLVSEMQVVQLCKTSKTADMPHLKGGAYDKKLSLN